MARIPVYEESGSLETGGTPTPRLPHLPESAAGMEIPSAAANLGRTIQESAEKIEGILAQKAHLQARERAYDLSTKAAAELQDKLQGENGLLTRQGAKAHGILAGAIGEAQPGQPEAIRYQDSFDGFSSKLKERYLQQAGNEASRRLLARQLDSHILIARNAIVKHEAEQGRVAYQNSIESQVHALMDTGAAASTVGDLLYVMDQGDELRAELAKTQGADEATLAAVRLKTADEFAETAVKASIESDPAAAQALLDGVKDRLSETGRAHLQDIVNGKMLELRAGAVWDQVKGFQHPDGTVDFGKALDHARSLVGTETIPPSQRDHILNFVKQQAALADAALQDARQSQTRKFYNDAIRARNGGIPYEKAHEVLFKQMNYGFDEKDRDDKIKELQALYTKDDSFFDNALKHQTEGQKLMWQQIEDLATAKYGNTKGVLPGDEELGVKTKLKDAFMVQMKHQLIGLPPEQMWARALTALKDIVTDPGWIFDTKKPAWQIERDVRNVKGLQSAALETRYGGYTVSQARAYLIQQGVANPSPKDIKTLIERMQSRGR